MKTYEIEQYAPAGSEEWAQGVTPGAMRVRKVTAQADDFEMTDGDAEQHTVRLVRNDEHGQPGIVAVFFDVLAFAETDVVVDPERAVAAESCTGVSAVWCPRCGDCSCPEDDSGTERLIDESHADPACPLHGPASTHAGG